jgi:hypothetical protein
MIARMDNAPLLAPSSTADGRTVVDELPRRIDVLPGEAELVAQHLLDAIDALLTNFHNQRRKA